MNTAEVLEKLLSYEVVEGAPDSLPVAWTQGDMVALRDHLQVMQRKLEMTEAAYKANACTWPSGVFASRVNYIYEMSQRLYATRLAKYSRPDGEGEHNRLRQQCADDAERMMKVMMERGYML